MASFVTSTPSTVARHAPARSGSVVISSCQPIVPGSPTRVEPGFCPACQNETMAPVGSCTTDMRPASITSIGSAITAPPASFTAAVVASTSSTARYVFQCGGTRWAASSGCCVEIPAMLSSPSFCMW